MLIVARTIINFLDMIVSFVVYSDGLESLDRLAISSTDALHSPEAVQLLDGRNIVISSKRHLLCVAANHLFLPPSATHRSPGPRSVQKPAEIPGHEV
jgi:hypothetical protein